ncbi:unnamed protein product [Adineta steineri]|uniref:Uncharacterized protein n=1 Tax=Adineta steineri TaxID=433720 RepID=A0A818UDN6_9BILA|nr:unnamed protein product [Adineta steineri]CAF3696546.1 unnamed protein product [Adineta steineri]
MADIQKNGDVTGKSINVPLSTGFNQQKCQCQHSINVASENVVLNSSSISHQHVSTSGTSEVQLVISPTRPSRRCLSNASNDGDFQDVSYKKSKQINNQSGSTIRPQLLHHHNGNDTVNDNVNMNLNVNNHVTTTSSVISNNFTTDHNQQQKLLTTASARYALTRFPFPPHIVRFKSTNVSITHFKEEYTCLKRVLFCLGWKDFLFVYLFEELSLDGRCYRYWNKYLCALADSIDG